MLVVVVELVVGEEFTAVLEVADEPGLPFELEYNGVGLYEYGTESQP